MKLSKALKPIGLLVSVLGLATGVLIVAIFSNTLISLWITWLELFIMLVVISTLIKFLAEYLDKRKAGKQKK